MINTTDITDMDDFDLDALLGYEPTTAEILEDAKTARLAALSSLGWA